MSVFQVRKVCGRAELLPSDEVNPAYSNAAAKSSVSPGKVHAAASSSLAFLAHDDLLEGLHKQIGNFMASFEASRIFYMMLADTICEEYPRKHCWNGERIGEWVRNLFHNFLLEICLLKGIREINARALNSGIVGSMRKFAKALNYIKN